MRQESAPVVERGGEASLHLADRVLQVEPSASSSRRRLPTLAPTARYLLTAGIVVGAFGSTLAAGRAIETTVLVPAAIGVVLIAWIAGSAIAMTAAGVLVAALTWFVILPAGHVMSDGTPLVGAVLFLGLTALVSTLLEQHRRTSRRLELRCRELERMGSALRDHTRDNAVTVQRLQAACEQAERKWQEAEQKAARSRDLNALTATLGDSVDGRGSAEALVTHAPAAFGCDATAVLLLDAKGSGFEILASRGIPRSVARRIALTSLQHDTPHAAAIRDARTIRVRNRRELALRYDLAALSCVEPQTSALVVAPVLADGRVLGAFAVGYRAEQSFDGDEIETVELVADRLGRALTRVRRPAAAAVPLAG